MNDDTTGGTSNGEPTMDWKRLRSMTDEQVHAAITEDSDITPADEAFWKDASVVLPRDQETVAMKLDVDVLDWFRREAGYQTRINCHSARLYEHAKSTRPLARRFGRNPNYAGFIQRGSIPTMMLPSRTATCTGVRRVLGSPGWRPVSRSNS